MDAPMPDSPGAKSGLRTNLYCSRHRQNFRLALDALTTPKKNPINKQYQNCCAHRLSRWISRLD
jgi:hypothetical protein